jgi:hypothetical protein
VFFNEPPLLQSSIELSLLQNSIDNFIANRAAERKARIDLLNEDGTSLKTTPVQPVVSNAQGQLEYEFDAPSQIQYPAEVNVVPREPFDPDKEEFIAGFPIDDDLISPKPILGVKRDIYDPATQNEGSGDSCDEDLPEYDETPESDLPHPSPDHPTINGTARVQGTGLKSIHITHTPTSYKLATPSPQDNQWSAAMDSNSITNLQVFTSLHIPPYQDTEGNILSYVDNLFLASNPCPEKDAFLKPLSSTFAFTNLSLHTNHLGIEVVKCNKKFLVSGLFAT